MALRAITTVYSYRHPETRRVVDQLVRNGFPHETFLRATCPPGALDHYHQPVIDKVMEFYRGSVPELSGFPHRYPTSGSEEGIREVMTRLQTEGVREIYVFQGEYEGYKEVASQRGMRTVEVSLEANPQNLKPGYWFVSNPFAKNGNILPDKVIVDLCEAGHQVFYDLAYLGATAPHRFDISHPNIFAAVVSFSKTYGLFYDRIGFAFSREPVPSLYGNKWFKSIFGLMIAEGIVKGLTPEQIYQKYSVIQRAIIDDINREFGLGMQPSDAFLLGRLTEQDAARLDADQLSMIARFKRGDSYRFCLTPYFIERDEEAQRLLGAAQ